MSQRSTSCSNQALDDLPILNGLGKVQSWRGDFESSQSYMVERAIPILAMRSLVRKILIVVLMVYS